MGTTFGAVGEHPYIGNRACPRRALSREADAVNPHLRFDAGARSRSLRCGSVTRNTVARHVVNIPGCRRVNSGH